MRDLEGLRSRLHVALAVLLALGAVAHSAVMMPWYVEDAAISFAYAENLADGYGAVAQPGGERLEGYSNPTWVALLVALRVVGLPLYDTVHWLQLGFTFATVLAVWRVAREVWGDDADLQVVPPLFLAINAQFAIWGQAGLENGLWSLLFALAMWRQAVELRDVVRRPWSALAWLALALSRPEGIAYAAVAGAIHLGWHAERRAPGPVLGWLGLFFVPWTAYQAVHYWYFAWPFANTYYAKRPPVGDGGMLGWNTRWSWVRSFFVEMGQVFHLPVWLFGVAGHGGWRSGVVAATFVGLALVLELADDQRHLLLAALASAWVALWAALRDAPGRRRALAAALVGLGALFGATEALRHGGWVPPRLPVPSLTADAPPVVLGVVVPALALLALGQPRWPVRLGAWLWVWVAVAFAVYANGDWMTGYRWLALVTVPASLLFGWGVDGFARFFDDAFAVAGRGERLWTPAAVAAVGAVALLQLPANLRMTWKAKVDDADVAPTGIVPRIDHVRAALQRVGFDGTPTVLDVDMGAHLLWTDWHLVDVAGLVDLPFAHHQFDPRFLRQYVFGERRPEVLHLHGIWDTRSRLSSLPEFRRQYVEIPGYPAGRGQFHVGNHLRRDLIVRPEAPAGAVPVAFEGGLDLFPPRVRAVPAPDRSVAVDVGMRLAAPPASRFDFRVILFAARDGRVARAWDLPPGFDWLPPRDWREAETFVGPLVLPTADLAPGTYDLGYAVFRLDGTPIAPASPEPTPAFSRAEVRFPGALVVVDLAERDRLADAERDAALAAAAAGDCAAAEVRWRQARDHRPADRSWHDRERARVAPALATCWAGTADVASLRRAREWAFDAPGVAEAAAGVAAEREAAGEAAWAAGDAAGAFRAFADAAELDGTRSWARRRAEEARAAWLAE